MDGRVTNPCRHDASHRVILPVERRGVRMALVLCFNPGSNSLKFDLIDIDSRAARASEGKRLVTGTIDNIGKETSLELLRGDEKLLSKKTGKLVDMGDAVDAAVDALEEARGPQLPAVSNLDLVAVRVVHGGGIYDHAVLADEKVLRDIEALKELAPLHNPNALEIISKVRERQSDARVVVAFDTAFHQTLPQRAWRLRDRQGDCRPPWDSQVRLPWSFASLHAGAVCAPGRKTQARGVRRHHAPGKRVVSSGYKGMGSLLILQWA